MKSRFFKTSSVFVVLLILIAAVSTSAFAADGELTVNSKAVTKVGDRITYTLNLSDCEVPIIGLQMYVNYDGSKLKYVDDSLKFEKIDGVVSNTKLDNMIALSWTDISSETDFSKKSQLVSLQFDVTDGGECDISYFISHMYGDDMGYIKNYTITNDISANDEELISGEPAVVTTDEKFVSENRGSFINYSDSMGENSPNKDNHEKIDSTIVETKVVDVTRYENVGNTSQGSGGSATTILVVIGAVIIILAIVAVIIVKKRDESDKPN